MNEFTDLVTARRAQPGDDLLSSLITARDHGDALTDSELVSLVRDLIIAGSLVAAGTACANLGAGPHNRLGTWLARMDLELSLRQLATRLPGLRLDGTTDQLTVTTGLTTCGSAALPGTWSQSHHGATA